MQAPADPLAPRRPRLLAMLPLALLALLAIWAMLQLYVPRSSRACAALYREARTAADTARADATVPEGEGPHTTEPRSCRAIRSSGRWW